MRKSRSFRPTLNDKLEDRTVPSTLGSFSFLQSFDGGGFGRHGGFGHDDGGREGGGREGGLGGSSSSVLNQDARLVQQAFQSFQSSYLKAVAALRLTATTMAGPSTDGETAFDTAIHAAILKLNAAIAKDLGNLTNTAADLNTTIDGFTADLETELDSAGAGLANSTNTAVNALNREAKFDIRSALQQSKDAILNDTPTGTALDPSSLDQYRQDVSSAYQDFNIAISNAAQTALANGKILDGTAVSDAVTALKTALTTAATNDLGTAFPTSTANTTLTTKIDTILTNLTNQLAKISAPTTGSYASARLFTRAVNSVLRIDESQISRAISTAIQSYNNSLY